MCKVFCRHAACPCVRVNTAAHSVKCKYAGSLQSLPAGCMHMHMMLEHYCHMQTTEEPVVIESSRGDA